MVTEVFRFRPIYDVLLRGTAQMPIGLYHLQLATAEQLCRLHYRPGSIKAVKARLKTLTEQGYVQSDSIPTKQFRSPYYYVLGSKGIRYLEEIGLDTHESWRAGKEVDKSYLHLQHTLEVNDILIAAALLHAVDPRYSLESLIHERVWKRQPLKVRMKGHDTALRTFNIIPDGFLDFRLTLPDNSRRRMAVLLEHDRGTEEQVFFRQKIRMYLHVLKTGVYKDVLNATTVTIAFTTFLSSRRLEQLRLWTRQEVVASNETRSLGAAFCFAFLPTPLTAEQAWLKPCWYSAYDEQPIALLAA